MIFKMPIYNLDLSLKSTNDFSYMPLLGALVYTDNKFTIYGYNFQSSLELNSYESTFIFTSHPLCYDGINFFSDNVYFRINFIDKENPNYVYYFHRAVVDRYVDITLNEYDRIYKYNIKLRGDMCLDEPISVSSSKTSIEKNNINKDFSNFLRTIIFKPGNTDSISNRYYMQILKGDKYDLER